MNALSQNPWEFSRFIADLGRLATEAARDRPNVGVLYRTALQDRSALKEAATELVAAGSRPNATVEDVLLEVMPQLKVVKRILEPYDEEPVVAKRPVQAAATTSTGQSRFTALVAPAESCTKEPEQTLEEQAHEILRNKNVPKDIVQYFLVDKLEFGYTPMGVVYSGQAERLAMAVRTLRDIGLTDQNCLIFLKNFPEYVDQTAETRLEIVMARSIIQNTLENSGFKANINQAALSHKQLTALDRALSSSRGKIIGG